MRCLSRRYGVVPAGRGVHTVATPWLKTGTVWTRLYGDDRYHERRLHMPRYEGQIDLRICAYYVVFCDYINVNVFGKTCYTMHSMVRDNLSI